jgi:hypothetical protein
VQSKGIIFFLNLKLLVILLAAGCGFIQQNPHQNHIPDSKGNLDEIITELAPQGWKIHDKILWYTAENLYELINGRAEFYLAYDMVRMNFTVSKRMMIPIFSLTYQSMIWAHQLTPSVYSLLSAHRYLKDLKLAEAPIAPEQIITCGKVDTMFR